MKPLVKLIKNESMRLIFKKSLPVLCIFLWVVFFSLLFKPFIPLSFNVPGTKLSSKWEVTFSDPLLCKNNCKWDLLEDSSKLITSDYRGFLGLRMSVKSSKIPKVETLAVFLGPIGDIDETYWNGNLLGKTGKFFPDGQFAHHYNRVYEVPKKFFLQQERQKLLLRVQKVAGPGVGPYRTEAYLGKLNDLKMHANIRDFIGIKGAWIGAVVLFFIGISFFILFRRLTTRLDYLYIGISLVFGSIYGICLSFEPYFFTTEPGSLFRIHAVCLYTTIGFLVAFIREYCSVKEKVSKWLNIMVNTLCVLISVFIVDFDRGLFVTKVWYVYLIAFCIWTPYIFFKSKRVIANRARSTLLFCSLIFSLTIFNDMLITLGVIKGVLIALYGMFVFLGGVAVTLAQDFALDYIKSQEKVESYTSEMYENARQVAHDIRSPLTALNVVSKDLSGLPEGSRVLLRSSIQRIQDIANNLVSKSEVYAEDIKGIDEHNILESVLLLPVIEEIVSEKRYQLRSNADVDIVLDSEQAYGLFANVDEHVLKRVISNLINNSVEAFAAPGEVIVQIAECVDSDEVVISIKDNGKGIPKSILPKLGERGASFGKEAHEESGSGLGLYHAKSNVEKWGGRFVIESEKDKGTEVQLYLPKTEAPDWFVPAINLEDIKTIVILDDDESIHQVWDERLNIYIKEYKIDLKHARCPEAFETLIDQREGLLCLCDYELLGYKATGLDLIERNKLEYMAILVTSRYAEEAVQERCKKLGIKLIPKTSADLVPLKI